jgi:hypothetical protein
VTYSYSGTVLSIPKIVIFDLVSSSKDWQYLTCHDVNLLLNGSTRLPLANSHEGSVESGAVLEVMQAFIPTNQFLDIANAKTVEGKICNDVFTFTNDQLEALRDLASRMRP